MKQILGGQGLQEGVSPPARGRGLKQRGREVRPHRRVSPPARGRGLKHLGPNLRGAGMGSPPARGRGLKL